MVTFFAFFNLIFGIVLLLTGLRIYRPFSRERESEVLGKYQNFYRYGGIFLILVGLYRIIF